MLKLIFYLPAVSLGKIFTVILDALKGIWIFIKGIFAGLTMVKKIFIPAAKTAVENREATFNFI